MVLCRIGGPLVEFIRFSPRVLWYEFQTTNSSAVKLFWMISMMIFEVLRNGEVI